MRKEACRKSRALPSRSRSGNCNLKPELWDRRRIYIKLLTRADRFSRRILYETRLADAGVKTECYTTPIMSLPGVVATPSHPIRRVQQMRGKLDILYLLACVILTAFAFAFNWATGHRGVFLLDQSIIFDGGWRILQGQTPYKNFLIPFGPVTFYVQALFFWLFGVNWSATVLPACVFNALATLSVIRIVRLLGGRSRLLALCAGLATAICFQAPFGTLFLEQTAMFFDLLALQAVVESLRASGSRRGLWQLMGGFSLALAALSKQNYGLFFIPIVFAVVAAGELPDVRRACRSILLTGTGMAAAIAIFLGWVWVFSDLPSFVQRVLMVAGEIGRSRMRPGVIAQALAFSGAPNLFQIDLLGVFSGGIALSLACSSLLAKDSKGTLWRETAPACAVAILLPWFRSLTQTTTLNEWQNNFAFVGLAGCLGVSLLLHIIGSISIVLVANCDGTLRLPSARAVKICFLLVAGMWGAVVLGYEGRAAWRRKVQQFEQGSLFRDAVRVRGMERVRWGEPTSIGGTTILRRADFEALASYLSARGSNFFVVGDSTMLYGLLGVRSPQPLLYFQPSHSFLEKEIPRLDEMVSASLERNRVGVVVREKVMFLPEMRDAYTHFPRTWAWFTSNFSHVSDFGNYEIWERRPAGTR
jgi:4-amino-4-deoxy-L-arabinose transferase-like glycosyltransferase